MEYSARVLQLLAAGGLTLLMAALVTWRYRKRAFARAFAFCTFSYALYSWFLAGMAGSASHELAETWYRTLMPSAYFLVASGFHLCVFFSRAKPGFSKWGVRVVYGVAALFTLLRITGWDGGTLEYREGQGWFPVMGGLYKAAYAPYLLLTLGTGFGLVIKRWFKSDVRAEKYQIGYFFAALLSAFLLDTANLLKPIAFLGAFSPVAYTGLLAFTISRHRLFDISLIIRKGVLAAAISFLLVVAALALVLKIQDALVLQPMSYNIFSLVVTALLVAALTPFFWSSIFKGVSGAMGVKQVSLEKRLLDYSALLQKHVKIGDSFEAARTRLTLEAGVAYSAIYLRDKTGLEFKPLKPLPQMSMIPSNSLLLAYFSKSDTFLDREDLLAPMDEEIIDGLDASQRRQISGEMAIFGFQACGAIKVDGRLEGILALGPKDTDSIFTKSDLEFSQALCSLLSSALENSRLQDQIQQADRLSTLGIISAGLAHELRNPLTSISTFVQMMPVRHADESFREKFQRVVGGEIAKLQKLTEQLLAFARPAAGSQAPVDLWQMAERVQQLLKYQFTKKGVKLSMEGAAGQAVVSGNETELSQILINLLLNALQATEHGGLVEVKVGAGAAEASLSVSDSGCGMDEEQVKRIFDPFYTTKQDGTGLGLPTCQRVAEQHQGRISVESRKGSGSRFSLHLPLSKSNSFVIA